MSVSFSCASGSLDKVQFMIAGEVGNRRYHVVLVSDDNQYMTQYSEDLSDALTALVSGSQITGAQRSAFGDVARELVKRAWVIKGMQP